MLMIKSPNKLPNNDKYNVFLGGSIEMGNCEDWQSILANKFSDFDVTFLNPRRDDFDISQEQSINNKYFKEQVDWELDSLDIADFVVIYLDPTTKSPISLMELGLYKDKNMVVCCPDGFWRKGNVEIVCDRYDISLVHSFDELYEYCFYVLGGE